jgi:hypothetical protein
MSKYLDVIYYTMAVSILLFLSMVMVTDLQQRKARVKVGYFWAAIGMAVALVGGMFADLVLKNYAWFQQIRFSLYFLGFAIFQLGMVSIAETIVVDRAQPDRWNMRIMRIITWLIYTATVIIACFYLLNPKLFIFNQRGMQIQRIIYWLPMLVVSAGWSIGFFYLASIVNKKDRQSTCVYTGIACLMILIGLLKESLIIGELGQPLINLLFAFLPFLISSIFLWLATRKFFQVAI